MPYYSISVPERMPAMAGQSNGNIFDIIVDVENNRVEFRSTDQKSIISLDLICVAEVEDILCQLVSSREFQTALAKKLSEHLGRHDAKDSAVPYVADCSKPLLR